MEVEAEAVMVYLTDSVCGCGYGWLKTVLKCKLSSWGSRLLNGYVGRQCYAIDISEPY